MFNGSACVQTALLGFAEPVPQLLNPNAISHCIEIYTITVLKSRRKITIGINQSTVGPKTRHIDRHIDQPQGEGVGHTAPVRGGATARALVGFCPVTRRSWEPRRLPLRRSWGRA